MAGWWQVVPVAADPAAVPKAGPQPVIPISGGAPLERRRAGVLLHPTSLPGPWPAGVLGADARRFVDLLAAAGVSVWQCLPVGPAGPTLSPYQSSSAFAGDSRLIDPAAAGATMAADAGGDWARHAGLLHEAWLAFRESAPSARQAFANYRRQQCEWLLPYTLFRLCRERLGTTGWWHWPDAWRDREPAAMSALVHDHHERLAELAFEQFLFDRQWSDLRRYARERGVYLFGDLPIYMDLDSADVWWHRALFRLDERGLPYAVAGVPPDYFSADGQLWGNPLYDWERHRSTGFHWWTARLRSELRRFDVLRVDHFRGLRAYWEVPAGAATAREGRWVEAPGDELLTTLAAACGGLPLVAEDLGTITPDVIALRERFGLPGMLILQFAFDGSPDNPYLPSNHREQAVVYPGTHDNDTLRGWYAHLDEQVRDRIRRQFSCNDADAPGAVLRAAWDSPARLAVVPLQDLLGLGGEARMNTPATTDGNWRWRFRWEQVGDDLAGRLRDEIALSGRLVPADGVAGQPESLRYNAS